MAVMAPIMLVIEKGMQNGFIFLKPWRVRFSTPVENAVMPPKADPMSTPARRLSMPALALLWDEGGAGHSFIC